MGQFAEGFPQPNRLDGALHLLFARRKPKRYIFTNGTAEYSSLLLHQYDVTTERRRIDILVGQSADADLTSQRPQQSQQAVRKRRLADPRPSDDCIASAHPEFPAHIVDHTLISRIATRKISEHQYIRVLDHRRAAP